MTNNNTQNINFLVESVTSIIRSLSAVTNKLEASRGITIPLLTECKNAAGTTGFLLHKLESAVASLQDLKDRQNGIIEKYKAQLDELDSEAQETEDPTYYPPGTTKWADMQEFDDLRKDFNNGQASTPYSSADIKAISRGPVELAATLPSCIPGIPVNGIYRWEKSGVTQHVPVIENLTDIPTMFYYYPGDAKNKPGIYCSPTPRGYVRIPDVEVVPEAICNSKHRTISCKDKLKCLNPECSFQHPGGQFVKVGVTARCPSCPSFGNKSTLGVDLQQVNNSSARQVLMYGCNDMWAAAIWIQNVMQPEANRMLVVSDLEICEPDESDMPHF